MQKTTPLKSGVALFYGVWFDAYERYFMKRLKRGRFVMDTEEQSVDYILGREASYEQLLEADWKFLAPSECRTAN
ncbi:hypothetical protein AALB47_27680 [Lachnospiraceae bacterium 54-11]